MGLSRHTHPTSPYCSDWGIETQELESGDYFQAVYPLADAKSIDDIENYKMAFNHDEIIDLSLDKVQYEQEL